VEAAILNRFHRAGDLISLRAATSG
jgi:hypothetical protein